MKIVLTGGGSGGHFYPLVAVAQQIRQLVKERRLLEPELYYLAPSPFDERLLFETGIEYRFLPAGKMRRYFSLLNALDLFKTLVGLLKAALLLFSIFPDVVFSKGGYASFPVVFAARLFGIPVVIHESDAIPGRANRWAGRFARAVGISYPEAAQFFPKEKVALVGNPVRATMFLQQPEGAHEFLELSRDIPVLLILGGSQGAARINETVLAALPQLLVQYQIIHQTGERNHLEVVGTARVVVTDAALQKRYHPMAFLNELALRMAAGAADLVISRAGSGAIFEIAAWGKPAILIPIPEDIAADQRRNAFAYARAGACVVIEEHNLTPNLFFSEVHRLMEDTALRNQLADGAKSFARPDAASTLANEVLTIALEHEE